MPIMPIVCVSDLFLIFELHQSNVEFEPPLLEMALKFLVDMELLKIAARLTFLFFL